MSYQDTTTRLTHEQAVEQIKALDRRETMTAFEMGDIAFARVPIADTAGPNRGGYLELARLANDAGVAFETLRERRFVASRIPPAARATGVAYAAYREIASANEALRSDLLTRVQSSNPNHPKGRWTAEAIQDIKTRAAMRRAGIVSTPLPTTPYTPSPEQVALDKLHAGVMTAFDIEGILWNMAKRLEQDEKKLEIVLQRERPSSLNLERLDWAISYIRRIADRVEAWRLGGTTDVDVFFRQVIEGSK